MFKNFLTAMIIIFTTSAVYANLNEVFVADIQYDWINKTELEKEDMIKEVHDFVFEKGVTKQHGLKSTFKDKIKDKNHLENYYAASAGLKEYKGNKISAFYIGKMKNIYMYGLQDKQDTKNAFYYDALGNLKYIDYFDGYYPDYPYYTVQYRISGTPASVIYYASKDCQYLFKPNGKFEGVWYKHNLYNTKNKIILKRTAY